MKNIQTIIIALTCSILLGACSAVRQCKPPELNLPESIISGATDTLTLADIEWWRLYGDSALCDIISRTLENNRNIQAAAAHIEQLRELYNIRKAEFLPTLNVNAGADYETNDYAGESSVRDPEFDLKASLSWELDLWGNLRWAKKKGEAEWLASVEDERAMRMTLIAEVASAYFRLVALDNELSIVRRTLEKELPRQNYGLKEVLPQNLSISRHRWNMPPPPHLFPTLRSVLELQKMPFAF